MNLDERAEALAETIPEEWLPVARTDAPGEWRSSPLAPCTVKEAHMLHDRQLAWMASRRVNPVCGFGFAPMELLIRRRRLPLPALEIMSGKGLNRESA